MTTLREDVATDGRHAEVRFGRDFFADAQRRDFTINAFFMDRAGQIYDYVGGFEDIETKRLRFIGDPMRRIAEDYLRILRFFRFSADFAEGPPDTFGVLAAIRQREGLSWLSHERVRAELFKLLCTRRAGKISAAMAEAGLLAPLLGLCPFPARLKRFLDIELETTAPDPVLRLAALCLTLPEAAFILREKLRLSNDELGRLLKVGTLMIKLHGKPRPPEPQALKTLLFQHGRQAALDALRLAQAEAPADYAALWEQAKNFLRETPEPKLPFSGKDLLARGIGMAQPLARR
jgi:poly(A) polymerase